MHKESRAGSVSIRVVLSASDSLSDAIGNALVSADDISLRVCLRDIQSIVGTCAEFEPHLVVLEKRSHLQATVSLLQRLQAEQSGMGLLIITDEPDPVYAQRLLREGARGCLLESSLEDDLASTIRLAASGKTVLSPLIARALLTFGE